MQNKKTGSSSPADAAYPSHIEMEIILQTQHAAQQCSCISNQ